MSAFRENLLTIINERGLHGTAVEVGVKQGKFSAQILKQWPGKKLYMVDAWRWFAGYDDVANVSTREHLNFMGEASHRAHIYGERACIIRDLSSEAAKLFQDGSLDWVYLDANHSHKGVLEDLAAWYPKVKNGGMICGDDFLQGRYFHTDFGVVAAVNEFFADKEHFNHLEKNAMEDIPQWWVFK